MGKPWPSRSAARWPPRSASSRRETGVVPGLTVILVGDDPASQVYVRNKQKACTAAGMNGAVLRLPATVSQDELLATIDRLNADPAVHGILVQMPLPRQIDEAAVVERVAPLKDVDGFHPFNFGLLAAGTPRFVPCTPLGIRELLDPRGRRDPRCARGRPGPVADRGQADGVSPASERAGGRRDRDGLPHRDPRRRRLRPPGRYAHRRDGPARAGHRRLGQARCRRDRRGHSQARRRPPLRRRRFRQRGPRSPSRITPVPGGVGPHARSPCCCATPSLAARLACRSETARP